MRTKRARRMAAVVDPYGDAEESGEAEDALENSESEERDPGPFSSEEDAEEDEGRKRQEQGGASQASQDDR